MRFPFICIVCEKACIVILDFEVRLSYYPCLYDASIIAEFSPVKKDIVLQALECVAN